MSFVSFEFVAFFAAVIVGLALMPTSGTRLVLLLIANVVFYGAGTPSFLVVLAIPSLVDYACAIRMEAATDDTSRRRWLLLSLITNLGILVYFKYANFFIDTVAALLQVRTVPLDVVLPVGISFFTFKTMSYTIDVYRRQLPASRSWWRYAMFVSFFPELVAGPIVRASVFLPQMDRPIRLQWHRITSGARIVLVGVTKKLLIADRLSSYVDAVFAAPNAFSPGAVASAVVAYSIQIYCDFSGYSDMAVGIARMIGFDLPMNFDMPYVARSIAEFWRRWHITLSQWLRDYLYIPLGGNRRGRSRTYVNLLITMLLGGLWHGASWTFVLWGLWHGLGLAAHKIWTEVRGPRATPRSASVITTPIAWATTYVFVCLGWVLFRSPDLATAAVIFRKLAGLAPGGIAWSYAPVYIFAALLAFAHAIGMAHHSKNSGAGSAPTQTGHTAHGAHTAPPAYATVTRPVFVSAFVLTVWLLMLYLFIPLHRSPFIYFQF
ncbi:MAG TPA: MBOAT family protein [Gemmatimonadaceae bacterium]|nr:MBOAT family protein [Gemmatimonadaceae bacterium]